MITREIKQALSMCTCQVSYVPPKGMRHGFFEISVTDYAEYVEYCDSALRKILDEYDLFWDDDSDKDFNLGASWDI